MLFGNKIRALRDEQGVLQRQLAAYLEIDTPMFSKIERGDRRAKRSQVTMLAEYFHVDENKKLSTLCPHTYKILAFYFVVSCICTNFAIGNRLKWG